MQDLTVLNTELHFVRDNLMLKSVKTFLNLESIIQVLAILPRLTSSTNLLSPPYIPLSKLFTKVKDTGPKTELWGIPVHVPLHVDVVPMRTTLLERHYSAKNRCFWKSVNFAWDAFPLIPNVNRDGCNYFNNKEKKLCMFAKSNAGLLWPMTLAVQI